ncbi:MAG: D-glycero-beta-D-manno-heptose 1,7-bisphosphate 7-phosphatase [Epsilonproteobacteria bacterium]|nr:D-glycero-beta-D-manno-heptose 1,7-bisphosphate 7-phosphatase [Campylobacterota bacterium]
MNKAIFLDRDGIINIDKTYLYKIEDFEFCDGIFEALKKFQKLGYLLIIVTNQSGIGRGYYNEKNYERLTNWMLNEFEKNKIKIQKVYHCPHTPEDNCGCRKPKPYMIHLAIKEFEIEPKNSWMIGDKLSDIKAGLKAGITNTIFIKSSTCKEAKYSVKSILDTISIIKK